MYHAPEQLAGHAAGTPADVWAVARMLRRLLPASDAGRARPAATDDLSHVDNVRRESLSGLDMVPSNVLRCLPPALVDIITTALSVDPAARPLASAIVLDPVFKGVIAEKSRRAEKAPTTLGFAPGDRDVGDLVDLIASKVVALAAAVNRPTAVAPGAVAHLAAQLCIRVADVQKSFDDVRARICPGRA